jgi:hypothetical protein
MNPTSSPAASVTVAFHPQRLRHGRIVLAAGPAPTPPPAGRLPRITRLLALAHRLEKACQRGDVANYAELARRGQVSRARITQIMNLLLLAPTIQEQILFLPRVLHGRDPIYVQHLQPLALTACWYQQRTAWQALLREHWPELLERSLVLQP